MALFDWLNPLNAITGALTKAYEMKLAAGTNAEKIAADVEIENLKARRDVIVAASVNDKWWSPRTVMGWVAALYVFKIVAWDTVFKLGVTPDPGAQVTFIVMTIVGFYFVSKGAETIANTIAGVIARKGR